MVDPSLIPPRSAYTSDIGRSYYGQDRIDKLLKNRQLESYGNKPRGWCGTYKKGGKVTKTGKALVHKGEYILPKGVKPTKAQVKKVAAMKKRK